MSIADIYNALSLSTVTHVSVYKPRQVRLTMNEEMQRSWAEVMKNCSDLSEAQVCTMIMAASLRALKDADYRITLPITFSLSHDVTVGSGLRR